MGGRSKRFWYLFSAIGLPLWIGATVLAAVRNDDPADPTPIIAAFVVGGTIFFGLMFTMALLEQVRWRADSGEARFGRGVAIGYSLAGAVTTGLGLAAIWRGGIQEENVAVFVVPMVAIIVVWAIAAMLLIRRYTT